MKFSKYVHDKIFEIVMWLFVLMIIIFMLQAFCTDISLTVVIGVILTMFFALIFVRDFFRRKSFYDELMINIDRLDKKYLVMEMVNKPEFYDGEIFAQAFYEINKSMI